MAAKADPHRFDDLFELFGPIDLRRFFGGEGIYAGSVMIGMIFDEKIYFKTDDNSRKPFVSEGCVPFSFLKKSSSETIVTSWFALPDRLYDDPDELALWARAALNVGNAAPEKKRRATKATRRSK